MRSTQNLLDYYQAHGISPVLYKMENWYAHFQRRDAVYRFLGAPEYAFHGARVLEVAAGSGQNAAYLASLMPAQLHLIEPNAAGLRDIASTFDGLPFPHTKPEVYALTLDEFETEGLYDIVICENWLGSDDGERKLRRKLSELVRPGGLVISTCVNLVGFLPNVLRRMLANRIDTSQLSYPEQVKFFCDIFEGHLKNLEGMTRSVEDWVKDCILNPHYLQVGLDFKTLLEDAGDDMEVCGSVPQFSTDFRWFKQMVGSKRAYNVHFVEQAAQNVHNFLSHSHLFLARHKDENHQLQELAEELWLAGLDADGTEEKKRTDPSYIKEIGNKVELLVHETSKLDEDLSAGFCEFLDVWKNPDITSDLLKKMRFFPAIFGREMMYCSMTKSRFAKFD